VRATRRQRARAAIARAAPVAPPHANARPIAARPHFRIGRPAQRRALLRPLPLARALGWTGLRRARARRRRRRAAEVGSGARARVER
jgi:hypothetical protein